VLFQLDADRRPLLAAMLAAAIVQDLITIAAERQGGHDRPGFILIDEFAAIAARHVVNLFYEARSANLSLLLLAQDIADLAAVILDGSRTGGIQDQVAGSVGALIARRQILPKSAELLAGIAGTHGTWVTTEQTRRGVTSEPAQLGTRTRGREYVIHPDEIKELSRGEAAVILPEPSRKSAIARMLRPDQIKPPRAS
jgi:hypothetical protein